MSETKTSRLNGLMKMRLSAQVPIQYPPKYRYSTRPSTAQVEKLVLEMNNDFINVADMMKLCGIVRRKTMQDSYIAPALAEGAIERKYPNQIHRPDQMYRLTVQAKAWKEWQKKKNKE